jgi:nucleoprotein TPR
VEEQLELVNDQIQEERKLWDAQNKKVDLTIKDLEKSLEDSRSQNALLHRQLAAQGDQLAKFQSDKIDAAAATDDATGDEGDTGAESLRSVVEALRKSESDLRETVRYMRSENETSRAREDAARRTAETEKAVAAATKRSLAEACAELKTLRSNQAHVTETDGARTRDLAEKLEAANEQLTLLRESNKLLREESDKFQAAASSLQSQLSIAKTSVAPIEKRLQDLEVDKGSLEAEKASLTRELEAWKGRVRNLVSSSKQVEYS